ncbi:hypothetical protein [Haloglycomyces albus]|uniref:hypothetical protein n=1 Tax=Haloglycomyces albus TaxID=526067 RepID=UPI00046D6EBD|nr:hypothetical protein [Haloglycomyces albus]
MSPQPRTGTSDPKALPLVLDAAGMQRAILHKEVQPLSPMLRDIVRYKGHWWVADDREWVRVTAPAMIDKLDQQKKRSAAIYANLTSKKQ